MEVKRDIIKMPLYYGKKDQEGNAKTWKKCALEVETRSANTKRKRLRNRATLRETIDERKHARRKRQLGNREKDRSSQANVGLDVEPFTVKDSLHLGQHLVLKLH